MKFFDPRAQICKTTAALSLSAALSIAAVALPSTALAEDASDITQLQAVVTTATTEPGSEEVALPQTDSTTEEPAEALLQETPLPGDGSADPAPDAQETEEPTIPAVGEETDRPDANAKNAELVAADDTDDTAADTTDNGTDAGSDADNKDDEPLAGERLVDGRWYFYKDDGSLATGWKRWSDGSWSYFGADGAAYSGWKKIGGKWYYFDPDDSCHTSGGEKKVGSKTYSFDDAYAMVTGWRKWADGWSYADDDGAEHAGWLLDRKKWYYLDPTTLRALVNEERAIKGKTYGFDKTCAMVTGWKKWSDGKWAYADKDGAEHAGWLLDRKKWYYLDPTTLRALVNEERAIKGKTYGFDKTCAMVTGWRKWANGWTYADKDGAEHAGWLLLNKKWYYMVPGTLRAATNQYTVKGKLYYFDSSCAMITKWHKWSNGWSWSGTDGAVRSGWQLIGSKWYYLNPTTLRAVTGEQTIKDKKYYFYGSCAMATGVVSHADTVRLYGSDGALIEKDRFSKVNGYWYYLKDLTPVKGDLTDIDGKQYYFNDKYQMHTGWRYIDALKQWVLYGNDGAKTTAKAGWFVSSDGKTYSFYSGSGSPTNWNKLVYQAWQKIQFMTSRTQYLGVIDQSHTYTSFFIKQHGIWAPYKSWLCSVGAHNSTPKGSFEVRYHSRHQLFDSESGSTSSVWYWTAFGPKGQAFHSVLCYKNSFRVRYSGLGGHNSHGCVRSPLEMAKWAYNNVGAGTKIYSF